MSSETEREDRLTTEAAVAQITYVLLDTKSVLKRIAEQLQNIGDVLSELVRERGRR
jgi:hypothetical protein